MLRIGVFGVGHLGRFHLNNWKHVEGVSIMGFYDPSDEAGRSIEEEYGITRFTNPEDLMDMCDAVDIVAPTTAHYHLCKMAVLKSKHIFVEKPLVNSMDEAREIAYHLHNLPHLLLNLEHAGLHDYYWRIERPELIQKLGMDKRQRFDDLWSELEAARSAETKIMK